MAIKRVDPIDGNDAADGSTWSLAGLPTVGPRKSYVLAGDAAGDEIRWLKTPDPAALGVNATFTDGSPTVSLASAVTANIDMCESLWTASANVTASLSTTIKREGTNANSFAIAAGFVTGKVAYNSFASKNLSTYTHVYCWIYVSVAVAANTLRLDLCSDTAGDTPVNSYTIPYALAAGYFHCITFDNGAALGAAIQSVALIALLDPGAVTVNIDNIIAGTEFGLASVIGKNDGFWWPILSINGTTVTIGCNSGAGTGGTKPYCGTTETVPCYYRYNPQMIFATINLLSSGSAGSLIKYLGGWNSASDTQDGETWLMPSSPSMDGINTNSKGYFRLEEIHVLAPQQGFYFLNTSYCEHHNISVVGGHLKASIYWRSSAGEIIGTGNTKIIGGNQADIGYCGHIWGCEKFTHPGDLYCYGNGYIFYNSDTLADFPGTVDIQRNGSGIRLASRMHIGTLVSKNNIYGVVKGAAHAAVIDNLITSNNTVAACYLDSAIGGEIRVKVGNISEAIAILAYKCSPYESFSIEKYQGVTGRRVKEFKYGGYFDEVTGGQAAGWWTGLGGTGKCLYLSPSSTTGYLPTLTSIPCTAGVPIQFSFQHVKTAGTPTLTFSASGAGITPITDAAVTLNTTLGTYTSASMTPTETGFIDIELKVYDGSTTGDIAIGHLRAV